MDEVLLQFFARMFLLLSYDLEVLLQFKVTHTVQNIFSPAVFSDFYLWGNYRNIL